MSRVASGPDRPTSTPALGDEAHVWHVALDEPGWPAATALSSEERARAARLRREGAARRWVAARWALRGILARYLGANPTEIAFQLGRHGKPALAERSIPLRFSLSHSGEFALLAISQIREVGIDIEWMDPGRDIVALASQALDERAAGAVRTATAEDRSSLFHAAWTRREAVAKCLGTGLVAPSPEVATTVTELDAAPGYAAALAVAGDELPALRHFKAAAEPIQRLPDRDPYADNR